MIHVRLHVSLAAFTLAFSAPLAAQGGTAAPDPERGIFASCVGAHRVTCVVDGDTIWYRREKIRVADINAPELMHPSCAFEARLAAAATARLTALLNAGAFALEPWPARRIDRYGRSLYVLTRGGRSLGLVLVNEGLAERWKGYRGSWCDNGASISG
jgi:micrococcal nuclease